MDSVCQHGKGFAHTFVLTDGKPSTTGPRTGQARWAPRMGKVVGMTGQGGILAEPPCPAKWPLRAVWRLFRGQGDDPRFSPCPFVLPTFCKRVRSQLAFERAPQSAVRGRLCAHMPCVQAGGGQHVQEGIGGNGDVRGPVQGVVPRKRHDGPCSTTLRAPAPVKGGVGTSNDRYCPVSAC